MIIYKYLNYYDCECKKCDCCGSNDAAIYHFGENIECYENMMCYENGKNRICYLCHKKKIYKPIVSKFDPWIKYFLLIFYFSIFSLLVCPLTMLMNLMYFIQSVCSETLNKVYLQTPIFQTYSVNKLSFDEFNCMSILNKFFYYVDHIKNITTMDQIGSQKFFYFCTILMIFSHWFGWNPYYLYFIVLFFIDLTTVTQFIVYSPFIVLYTLMISCMYVYIVVQTHGMFRIIDKYGYPLLCSNTNNKMISRDDITTNQIINKIIQLPLIVLELFVIVYQICIIFVFGDKN